MIRVAPLVSPWSVLVISFQMWCCLAGIVISQDYSVAFNSGSNWGNGWNNGAWNGNGWNGNGWNGSTGTGRNWKLGVTGTNTETGVVINSIVPNSAAARAGLTPGDLIVCVDGDQVGLVSGKVFDISEELNHHADAGGRVRLLVQPRRTLKLSLIQVQLDDEQRGLSGTVLIPDGRLPANAIVTVQLENVTRPHFAVRNGQQTFRVTDYSQNQIPFTIPYDPRYISPSDAYRVRAYVTLNGSTIYDTPQPPYVLTQGNPNTVQLVLRPSSFAFSGGTGNVVSANYADYDSISQQIDAAYQRYLGRQPSSIELAAWQSLPDIQRRMERLPLELMASQEFYDRTGNNNVVWIRDVFTRLIGRPPTPTEVDQWMRRFSDMRYSRMEILNEMYQVRR